MKDSQPKKTSLNVSPVAVKLGLFYALLPLLLGVVEAIWGGKVADSAMMWMSVAAGFVFITVVLAYSKGFAAGRSAREKAGNIEDLA